MAADNYKCVEDVLNMIFQRKSCKMIIEKKFPRYPLDEEVMSNMSSSQPSAAASLLGIR